MKHVVIALLTLVLFATSCTAALAEEGASRSGTTPKPTLLEKREQRIASGEARMMDAKEKRDEKMASRSADLKAKLAAFKDKQKAVIVDRVNTVLNKINTNRTDAMKKHLDKMVELLGKLQVRVDKKATEGKDAAAANAAIASASAAIESALEAVDSQALKDYTIAVSSESAARADAKTARDKLHTDLQEVRKLVVAAKQALANAVRVAATTLGGIGQGGKE